MRYLLVAVTVFAAFGLSRADVFWSASAVPTASQSGYWTYVITLMSDNDDYIVGWEGSITGSEIHQQNPFGSTVTIFRDNNHLFEFDPATNLDADSQYMFQTSAVDSLNGVVVGSSGESSTDLSAAFALIGGRSNPHAGTVVDLAQVCVPEGGSLLLTGVALLRTPANVLYDQAPTPTPEPACLAVLALGGVAILRRRRG